MESDDDDIVKLIVIIGQLSLPIESSASSTAVYSHLKNLLFYCFNMNENGKIKSIENEILSAIEIIEKQLKKRTDLGRICKLVTRRKN